MYILSNENKVYCSRNIIYHQKDVIDSWVDVKGIYTNGSTLYGVKEDNNFTLLTQSKV